MNEEYPHLQEVLSRSIYWDFIRQQYEQIIKANTLSCIFSITGLLVMNFYRK